MSHLRPHSSPASPALGPWGQGPPGEEDVGLIFEMEAQEGRVVFLGALLLVAVTAGRARQQGGEGAHPPSTQPRQHPAHRQAQCGRECASDWEGASFSSRLMALEQEGKGWGSWGTGGISFSFLSLLYWLIKSCRFHSIIRPLYIVSWAYHPKSSLLPSPFMPLSLFYLMLPFSGQHIWAGVGQERTLDGSWEDQVGLAIYFHPSQLRSLMGLRGKPGAVGLQGDDVCGTEPAALPR